MKKLICLYIGVLGTALISAHAADNNAADVSFDLAQVSAAPATKTVTHSTRRYGPVRKKENLWIIAQKFSAPGITMSQLVMSIYAHNRHAFYKDNINRLKPDVMLDIPANNVIQTTEYQTAYSEVLNQIAEYEVFYRQRQQEQAKTEQLQVSTPVTNAQATTVPAVPAANTEIIELSQIEEIKQALHREDEKTESAAVAAQQAEIKAPAVVKVVKPRSRKKAKPERPLLRFSYNVSVTDDSNIRKAENDVDIRSDVITSATLIARGGKSMSRFSLFSYGGSLTYEAFNTFDTLDNLNYNVNAKYRFSTSAGFIAPLYGFGIKLGGIDSESEMRDSTLISVSIDVNKWLTNTIRLTTGLEFRQSESKSQVFDTVENRFFVNLDLNLSKTALIYGTYTFISGDIVSSASPTLKIINAADAIEPDDAFGAITTNQFAYRLDADTQLVTLGYNKIMTRAMSIDVSARMVATEASGDIQYDRSILRASLLGRF